LKIRDKENKKYCIVKGVNAFISKITDYILISEPDIKPENNEIENEVIKNI